MVESRCGLLCSQCGYRESTGCKGCVRIEKPFWGEKCPVKSCCQALHGFAYDPQQGDGGARIRQCGKWRG